MVFRILTLLRFQCRTQSLYRQGFLKLFLSPLLFRSQTALNPWRRFRFLTLNLIQIPIPSLYDSMFEMRRGSQRACPSSTQY
jgi:hypothetical protein